MITFYSKTIEIFEKEENQQKFRDKNVTPVGYIDLYAGQEQDEDNFELFSQPAILIDWDIDHQTDPATATVTFYCCYEQLRDTSNISLNREMGLKFLEYVGIIDKIAGTIETENTGKLEIVTEGFFKMDSIVDIYLLTYECTFKGRKNPLDKYQEGQYDNLNLKANLKAKIEFD
ncbi:hypothetical protein [Flavobacterium sp. B183]|uniref:hypothetical protein n=1 Tax=Flavobacterium sp. B183 TaxID=907046 RepID=UPI00201F0A2A|nr:hypothetical protein [Flavobacterium sp. B183]URC13960.1 hypothetical protein M4I44_06060 [Flavobacterium sp. B183]URC14019.1 hypothetical protein M4I44_06420 [Flavobacterium sp. B183]